VWHAVVFVGMLERRHADPRKPRDGMPPLSDIVIQELTDGRQ
jgi:hypothetical protein